MFVWRPLERFEDVNRAASKNHREEKFHKFHKGCNVRINIFKWLIWKHMDSRYHLFAYGRVSWLFYHFDCRICLDFEKIDIGSLPDIMHIVQALSHTYHSKIVRISLEKFLTYGWLCLHTVAFLAYFITFIAGFVWIMKRLI